MVYNYIVVQVLGVSKTISVTHERTPMTRNAIIVLALIAASLMLGGCASGYKASDLQLNSAGKIEGGVKTETIEEDGKKVQVTTYYRSDGTPERVIKEPAKSSNPLAGFINFNVGPAAYDTNYPGGLWVPGGGGLDCLTYPSQGCDTQIKSGDFGGKKCN
jgi:hypothetical protein